MRKLMILLLLISGPIKAHPHESGLVAVIANFVELKDIPDACEGESDGVNDSDEKTVCISMDELYKATYTVREVIFGNVAVGSTLTFTIADHYGSPAFARYKTVLLFIQLNDGDPYLEKYQGFQVHETALGKWATCDYPRGADKEDGELESVAFANTVSFGGTGELNLQTVSQEFPSPVYEIRSNVVRCSKGWSVQRLVTYVQNGVLAARGELLINAPKAN